MTITHTLGRVNVDLKDDGSMEFYTYVGPLGDPVHINLNKDEVAELIGFIVDYFPGHLP